MLNNYKVFKSDDPKVVLNLAKLLGSIAKTKISLVKDKNADS